MDKIPHRDQPLERTAKITAKPGPKPWNLKPYIYEEPKGDHRLPHGDPRTEAPQSYDRHQKQFDSDFIPSDADHGYGYPVFSTMPDPNARASTTSELGTLAGEWGGREPLVNIFHQLCRSERQHVRDRKASQNARGLRGYHRSDQHVIYSGSYSCGSPAESCGSS